MKKYKHIEYEEKDGQLFRVAGKFRLPIQDLKKEYKKDLARMKTLKKLGSVPIPFDSVVHTLDNWEEDRDLPGGVYPPDPSIGREEELVES